MFQECARRTLGHVLPLVGLGQDRLRLQVRVGAAGGALFRQEVGGAPFNAIVTHDRGVPAEPGVENNHPLKLRKRRRPRLGRGRRT